MLIVPTTTIYTRANNGSAKKKLQSKKEAPKRYFTKMGIFYAKNPARNIAHIFPPRIGTCPKFSARGYKCNKGHNKCKHVFEAKKIPIDQIEAISDQFLTYGSGWFNTAFFVGINLKPKYKKLLGDANRPGHA